MEWSRWFWVALTAYAGGCVLWRRGRQWLSFYLWGAVGLALSLIYLGLASGWQDTLIAAEAQHIQWVVGPWISARPLGDDMLMIPDPTGWSILYIGIECSALLEMACLLGLVLFYPRFALPRRLLLATAGLGATYALNLGRLVVIVLITHYLGKQFVMIAHTIVGRLLFFGGTILTYWHLITQPTLTIVSRDVRERRT